MSDDLMRNRIQQLERALLAIEGLTIEDCGENKLLGTIYSIAHFATGRCCKHTFSEERLKQLVVDLKEQNIIDVDKILASQEA